MLHMGGGLSKKTSFRTFRGFNESKRKNEGLPNCAKGGGEGLKMLNRRKEKIVNSKKLKKTNQMLDRQIFGNLV